MKYLNGEYYVEVKDHRYRIDPTEKNKIRLRVTRKPPRPQHQVQNNTQIRKTQNVIKNDNDELVVKNYPKKEQPVVQPQPIFTPPNCPSCKQNNWLEFDKGYDCKNCEYIINKQKHQIDIKVLRQDQYFPTRLPHAKEKIAEIYIILWQILLIFHQEVQLKNYNC